MYNANIPCQNNWKISHGFHKHRKNNKHTEKCKFRKNFVYDVIRNLVVVCKLRVECVEIKSFQCLHFRDKVCSLKVLIWKIDFKSTALSISFKDNCANNLCFHRHSYLMKIINHLLYNIYHKEKRKRKILCYTTSPNFLLLLT